MSWKKEKGEKKELRRYEQNKKMKRKTKKRWGEKQKRLKIKKIELIKMIKEKIKTWCITIKLISTLSLYLIIYLKKTFRKMLQLRISSGKVDQLDLKIKYIQYFLQD